MSGSRSAAVDRTGPPPGGSPRPFHFPAFERHSLPGGPTLLVARLERVPLLYFDLIFPAGAHHEPTNAGGLASFVGSLLDAGTEQRSALEIAEGVEHLGGSLSTGADWNTGYVGIDLLSRHLEEGLEMLAELSMKPAFPEEEIERLRRKRLAGLVRRRDRPGNLADDHLARVLFGKGPYGTYLHGTEEDLERIDRQRVVDFYTTRYLGPEATLIAVGDLDPESFVRQASRMLETSRSGQAPVTEPHHPVPRGGISVHIIDRPGAAQTELRLGHATLPRSHPDFLTLAVANILLGGKFTSRINLNLRERHGYTYGASSRLPSRLGPGPFSVSTAVETQVTGAAVREILGELRRIRDEEVAAEELADTQSYLSGVFPYTLQTLGGVAKRLQNIAVFGLPDDYYERYPEMVRAISREEIRRVTRSHLAPDQVAVVAVGPAGTLRSQLAELGPVEVVSMEELTSSSVG